MLKRVAVALLLVFVPTLVSAQGLILRRSGVPRVTAGALTIVTTDCPDATVDVAYDGCQFTASGGTAPYTWAEVGSNLDAGGCAEFTLTSDTVGEGQTPPDTGTCAFTIQVTDAAMATVSREISFDVVTPGLPEGWSNRDIGSGQAAGSASEDGMGVFTVNGAGADVGTSSQLHFVYQGVTGNQEIVAQVTSCTAPSTKRCGVMLRTSLNPDAANVFCGLGTSLAPLMQYRLTDGATTGSDGGLGTPAWVRIVNDSGKVSCYADDDGMPPWTQVGSVQTLVISGTYNLGLAAFNSAAQAANLVTATVDNITIAAFEDEGEIVDTNAYRPHLRGYGSTTNGGFGPCPYTPFKGQACTVQTPTIYEIASLSESGAGTLRACMEASGPRICVFETSGTIVWTSTVSVDDPYLTVAGQTAPSPGITIKPNCNFRVNTHDIVMQHVRIAHGTTSTAGCSGDSIWLRGSSTTDSVFNVVLDHVTFRWGCDENIGISNVGGSAAQDLVIVDTIISEGLHNCPAASQPNHSKGLLFNVAPNGTAVLARSLISSNQVRNPLIYPGWRIATINNVIYNWRGSFGSDGPVTQMLGSTSSLSVPGTNATYCVPHEWVHRGNIAIPGPETSSGQKTIRISGAFDGGSEVFLDGNIGHGITGPSGDDQWAGVEIAGINTATHTTCGGNGDNTALTAAMVRIDSLPSWYTTHVNIPPLSTVGDNGAAGGTSEARDCVIANVGARPTDRDSADTRIVGDITDGGGAIVDTEADVGGFPALAVNARNYSAPASPFAVASGQTFRTNLWMQLENDADFGAQRLEDPSACGL